MGTGLYYSLKPLIPRALQLVLRQWHASYQRRNNSAWPILEEAGDPPSGWSGWPGGKRFAVVLTHDVEGEAGVTRCKRLADLEEERKFRSAFGFVPGRYKTPEWLRRTLADRGFEVMVHDLHHDGKLFRDWRTFSKRSKEINQFLKDWGTSGFCSAAMHHNLPWMSQLNIDYSVSTYDVDPFEPQACGVGRIFPFWVQSPAGNRRGFVEMPYTLPQDFTLFVLLKEQSTAIWRRKLDWIAAKGGMALIKTHPDYMVFPGERKRIDGYPVEWYTELLDYIRTGYGDEAWFASPSAVARHWRGLGRTDGGSDNAIPLREAFCFTCQQAHAAGWLSHFPLLAGVDGNDCSITPAKAAGVDDEPAV